MTDEIVARIFVSTRHNHDGAMARWRDGGFGENL